MWVPLHRNRAAHVNPEAAFLPARFLRTDDTDDSDATDDSETSVLSVSSVPSVVQGRVRLEPPDTMKATCRRWKLTRHYCRDKALVLCLRKNVGYDFVSHGICFVAEPLKWRCHSFGTCASHLPHDTRPTRHFCIATALAVLRALGSCSYSRRYWPGVLPWCCLNSR